MLIEAEKELILQEQIELTVLMPCAPSMYKLWFNNLVQIGYISFFSLSFPIAPLWGVLMGFLQVNFMFWVFGASIQRSPSVEAESIGIWEDIFFVYSLFTLIVNTFVLMFASKGIFTLTNLSSLNTSNVYTVTVGLIIAENVIFIIKFLIAAMIPDCPAWVRTERANQNKLKDFTLESEIRKKIAEQKRKLLLDNSLLKNFEKEAKKSSGGTRESCGPPARSSLGGPSEGGLMTMFLEKFRDKSESKLPN